MHSGTVQVGGQVLEPPLGEERADPVFVGAQEYLAVTNLDLQLRDALRRWWRIGLQFGLPGCDLFSDSDDVVVAVEAEGPQSTVYSVGRRIFGHIDCDSCECGASRDAHQGQRLLANSVVVPSNDVEKDKGAKYKHEPECHLPTR